MHLNFVFLSDKEAFRGTETRVWEEERKDESIRRTFWKANSSKHPDQLKQEYNKQKEIIVPEKLLVKQTPLLLLVWES